MIDQGTARKGMACRLALDQKKPSGGRHSSLVHIDLVGPDKAPGRKPAAKAGSSVALAAGSCLDSHHRAGMAFEEALELACWMG